MFAPAPPRCWTRSSTRKDSETFAIFPSTNWSVNRPGKVIRWSVAIEPVTTTDIEDSLAGGRRPGQAPRQRTGQTVGSVGERPAQLQPELAGRDHAEQAADGRAERDDDGRGDGPRHDARAAERETGQRHPGGPLP